MSTLLTDIDSFLDDTGLSAFRFGLLAAQNGRLVQRLREGRRIWPETEDKIRAFMAAELPRRSAKHATPHLKAEAAE